MQNTKIQWATHTFNPWIGCAKVHAGCQNCYAEAMAGRLGVMWGPHGTRRRRAKSTWKQVERWNRMAAHAADQQLQFIRPKCRDGIPVARPRVFPSLCDPFEDTPLVVAEWRRDFFALIDRCPNLDFLLLTKRPENVARMWCSHVNTDGMPPSRLLRKNVWLMYSASDHRTLWYGYGNIQACREVVPVWGLSLEPLIGPINLVLQEIDAIVRPQWVIVGGESGPRARPCDVSWIRSIVSQCREAGVPCFVKQLGANIECIDVIDAADHFPGTVRLSEAKRPNARVHLRDPNGGDPSEWPEDLRVREFPQICKQG